MDRKSQGDPEFILVEPLVSRESQVPALLQDRILSGKQAGDPTTVIDIEDDAVEMPLAAKSIRQFRFDASVHDLVRRFVGAGEWHAPATMGCLLE